MVKRQNYISVGIFMALALLVIPFQNCGVPPKSNTLVLSEKSKEGLLNEKIQARAFTEIEFFDEVARADQIFSLNLQLDTGVLETFDRGKNFLARYCPQREKIVELATLLQDSQVCLGYEPSPSELSCAQVYVAPYAILHNGQSTVPGNEVALGESLNSCDTRENFLCGDADLKLRQSLKDLISQLENMTCQ